MNDCVRNGLKTEFNMNRSSDYQSIQKIDIKKSLGSLIIELKSDDKYQE